jgi:hypothetical protein
MDDELVMTAAELRRKAPEGFQKFLEAFRAYTNKTKDECISSPIDTLPVAQGRARGCASVLHILDNCIVLADKREKKR